MNHEFFLSVPTKATARSRCGVRAKRWPYAYTAPSYRKWLEEALPALRKLAPDPPLPEEVLEKDVAITVEVRVKRPKTTKRIRPGGDNDNYEKGLWDAMTKVGGWWRDDEQIVENTTIKRWAEAGETPGYKVWVSYQDPQETK